MTDPRRADAREYAHAPRARAARAGRATGRATARACRVKEGWTSGRHFRTAFFSARVKSSA